MYWLCPEQPDKNTEVLKELFYEYDYRQRQQSYDKGT